MKPEDLESIEAQNVFLCEEVKEIHIHLERATNVAPPATTSNDNQSEEKPQEDYSGMTDSKAIEQLRELSLQFYQFDREKWGSWKPKEVADTLDEICQYLGDRL